MKPTKHGIKLFSLCESSSGYCCTFELYNGWTVEAVGEKTFALVFRLMQHAELLDKGYRLFTDSLLYFLFFVMLAYI